MAGIHLLFGDERLSDHIQEQNRKIEIAGRDDCLESAVSSISRCRKTGRLHDISSNSVGYRWLI